MTRRKTQQPEATTHEEAVASEDIAGVEDTGDKKRTVHVLSSASHEVTVQVWLPSREGRRPRCRKLRIMPGPNANIDAELWAEAEKVSSLQHYLDSRRIEVFGKTVGRPQEPTARVVENVLVGLQDHPGKKEQEFLTAKAQEIPKDPREWERFGKPSDNWSPAER